MRRNSQELAQAATPPQTDRSNFTTCTGSRDFYSLNFDAASSLENGNYGSRVTVAEAPTQDAIPSQDSRHAFLSEWRFIREKLQDWSPDLAATSVVASPALMHISESFRYAALLYTERLAYPTLPSSSDGIQSLVDQALSHIRDIGPNSCVTKFMLWPLFIAGTECVEERHKALIRARCLEIQKESGFYNNVSGLEVLERVWKENERDISIHKPCGTQAFRWRGCMDRVDGEYIVI